MYFLKRIIADKLLGLYQLSVKSCGWGGGEIALMNMAIRTKRSVRKLNAHFCSAVDMYVQYILHDTRVTLYKLLTLGQPVLALDDCRCLPWD